jgi:hypothetical protein
MFFSCSNRAMAKKDRKDTANIQFIAEGKLAAYLYDLIDEDGFGNSPTGVVQNLVWKAIYDLIDAGTITRRPGKMDDPD